MKEYMKVVRTLSFTSRSGKPFDPYAWLRDGELVYWRNADWRNAESIN